MNKLWLGNYTSIRNSCTDNVGKSTLNCQLKLLAITLPTGTRRHICIYLKIQTFIQELKVGVKFCQLFVLLVSFDCNYEQAEDLRAKSSHRTSQHWPGLPTWSRSAGGTYCWNFASNHADFFSMIFADWGTTENGNQGRVVSLLPSRGQMCSQT